MRGPYRVAAGVTYSVLATWLFTLGVSAIPQIGPVPPLYKGLGLVCAFLVSAPICTLMQLQRQRIAGLHRDLAEAYDRLQVAAQIDPLTGIANRASFIAKAEQALRRHPGWFILGDVDRFKAINDRFGHAAGDRVLVAIAATLRDNLRLLDLCGRLGGEEFGIFLPDVNEQEAFAAANRLHAAIAALTIEAADGTCIQPTISMGLSHGTGADLAAVINAADQAMYLAKRDGRNRIRLAPLK